MVLYLNPRSLKVVQVLFKNLSSEDRSRETVYGFSSGEHFLCSCGLSDGRGPHLPCLNVIKLNSQTKCGASTLSWNATGIAFLPPAS